MPCTTAGRSPALGHEQREPVASRRLAARHYDFIGKVFSKWAFCNPLHPDLHPQSRHSVPQKRSELSVWPHLTCAPGPCGRWTPRCRPRSRNSLIQAVLEALSLEVVRMVINLYNGGEDACAPVAIVPLPSIFEFDSEMRVLRPEGGAFTTGGTEPASHALSMHFSSQVHLS